MRPDHALALAGVLLVLGGMFGCGWYLSYCYYSVEVVAETPKHAINHDDGTVTAPVVVHEKPAFTKPTKPKGGTHIRTVEVTIAPPPPERKPEVGEPAVPCPPIDVRIDFDRYNDHLRASIWSSGEILDSADYPIESFIPMPIKHGLGVAAFTNGTKQVSYTRFFNHVSVSGYVAQDSMDDIAAGIGATLLLR